MPTVLREGGFRFFFFSNEGREPVHVHVESGGGYAKFWLDPTTLAFSVGMTAAQLRRLRGIVAAHEAALVEAWHGHFGR